MKGIAVQQGADRQSVLIHPRQPFNFLHTLKFILSPPALLNGRAFAPLMDHFQDGEYRRAIRIDGQAVLYGVSEERNGSVPALRIRVLKGPAGRNISHRVQQTAARQFSAELDLAPFYRMTSSDKVLAKLISRFRGMRIPQAPSVYECVVCAILEQQVNLTFAHQVKRALIETYGEAINFEGRRYNAFPEPQTLARVTPSELRKLQISGPKARYIIGISCAVTEDGLDLDRRGQQHAVHVPDGATFGRDRLVLGHLLQGHRRQPVALRDLPPREAPADHRGEDQG